MGKGNCEFKGNGGQYFPTVFIHLVLISLVTLGIYLPWAWVKVVRLKASHTVINGKRVTFSGTGEQLFVLALVNGLLTIITLGLYGPWAVCKIFNWGARNTLVEGKPSRFLGTGGSLFLFYLIHLMILPMLTLGIYAFLGVYRLYAWKEEHTRYGGEKTSFGAGFGAFLKISVLSWILNTITLNLFLPWSLCMFYRWQIHGLAVGDEKGVEHFPPVKISPVVVAILIIIGLAPFVAIVLYVMNQPETHLREGAGIPQLTNKMVPKDLQKAQGIRPPVKKPSPVVASRPKQKPGPSASQLTSKKPEKKAPDYDKEIKSLNALIKQDGRNADALYNRAFLYASKDDPHQAIQDYTNAIEINANHGDAHYNRGLLFAEMERYEEAIRDFDAAIKADRRAVDAYCNRANANYRLGKEDLAIQDYTAALKIAPNDADLYYNRGVACLSGEQKSKAMADFKKAAKLGHKKAKEYLSGEKGI